MEFIIIAIIAVILSLILGIFFGYNLKKVKKTVDTSHKSLYNSKASCGTEEFIRRAIVMGS